MRLREKSLNLNLNYNYLNVPENGPVGIGNPITSKISGSGEDEHGDIRYDTLGNVTEGDPFETSGSGNTLKNVPKGDDPMDKLEEMISD